MKKLLSVLLLLCMLLTLLPVAALADGEVAEAPATEQAAEESAENSAERDATDTPEETEGDEAANGSADESADTPTEDEANEEVAEAIAEPSSAEMSVADDEKEASQTELVSASREKPSEGETDIALPSLDGDADESRTVSVEVICNRYGTVMLEVNGEKQSDSRVSAQLGDTVTIIPNPQDGYGRVFLNGGVHNLTISEDSDGCYSFVVPEDSEWIRSSFYLNFYPDEAVQVTYHYQDGSTSVEWCLPDSPVLLECVNLTENVSSGWAVGSLDSDTILPAGSYQLFTRDTHLYAKYEKGVKLMFHYPDDNRVDYTSSTVLYTIDGNYCDENRALAAWSTEENGGGQRYEVGGSYLFTQDTEFYPVYGDSVSVTYHYCDGAGRERSSTRWSPKGSIEWIGGRPADRSFSVPIEGVLACWAVGSKDSSMRYSYGEARCELSRTF